MRREIVFGPVPVYEATQVRSSKASRGDIYPITSYGGVNPQVFCGNSVVEAGQMWATRVSMSTYAWARLEPRALQVMPVFGVQRTFEWYSCVQNSAYQSTYHGSANTW